MQFDRSTLLTMALFVVAAIFIGDTDVYNLVTAIAFVALAIYQMYKLFRDEISLPILAASLTLFGLVVAFCLTWVRSQYSGSILIYASTIILISLLYIGIMKIIVAIKKKQSRS